MKSLLSSVLCFPFDVPELGGQNWTLLANEAAAHELRVAGGPLSATIDTPSAPGLFLVNIMVIAMWTKTGPNPTDRRRTGSEHHVITDAQGIHLSTTLTGVNTHDVTQLLPLVEAIPPVRGKPGRPRSRPDPVQGDRGFDSQPHRNALRERGLASTLARRYTDHGSGLGELRWLAERTLAWLH